MSPLVLVCFAVISYAVAAILSYQGRKHEQESLRLASV